jgi:hypothetical protein
MPTDPRWLLGLLDALTPQRGPDGLARRHQPLTLLWAAGRARTGKERMAPWPVANREIGRLIEEFGRETDARNPHLPFHALAAHRELWELSATPPPKGRAGEPYDLRAVDGGDEVHVEVKGSTETADGVELTAGEVRHARDAATDLFVVDRIEWERLPDGGIRTSGGRQRRWTSWRPAKPDLEPTRYRYRLP